MTRWQRVICPKCGRLGRAKLEKTSCGNKRCKKCGGQKHVHGPYWYVDHWTERKHQHHYVGKGWPQEPSEQAIKNMIKTGVAKTKEEAVEIYKGMAEKVVSYLPTGTSPTE